MIEEEVLGIEGLYHTDIIEGIIKLGNKFTYETYSPDMTENRSIEYEGVCHHEVLNELARIVRMEV